MDGDEHQKRSVLITGCTTGGIGHALALELQREGFYVIATARNLDKMKDLVDHYLIETIQLDVCDPASISSARVAVEKLLEGSGLDILINNAGGDNNPAPAIEMDLQAAQDILDLNFFGAVRLIKAFSPMLMQSGSGRIVNISSGASIVPIPFLSAYGAAKAALNQYSDILRVELEPFNVAVTTVITGSVANSKDRSKLDLDLSPDSRYHGIRPVYNEAMQRNATQKLMPTEDYAKRLVWELMGSRPAQTLYIGRDSWYAWLMTTFAPRSWIHWLMVKMWGLKRSGSEKKTA